MYGSVRPVASVWTKLHLQLPGSFLIGCTYVLRIHFVLRAITKIHRMHRIAVIIRLHGRREWTAYSFPYWLVVYVHIDEPARR